MKVRDILPDYPVSIEVRTNSPCPLESDTLFGFCKWDGEKLISLDGDSYYLDEQIYQYNYNPKENRLTYWITSVWG